MGQAPPFFAELMQFFTSRQVREAALEDRSLRDSLSGLYHRRAAETAVNQALEAAPDARHAFILFDVDNFKRVNDALGHTFGDLVLTELSALLTSRTGRFDVLGRTGGDEFIALIRDCPSSSAVETWLDHFCRSLGERRFCGQNDLSVTVSAGLAFTPDHGTCYAELFEQADQALYQAKAYGKGTYQVAGALRGERDCYVSQRDLAQLMEAASDGVVALASPEGRLLPLYFNAPFLGLTGLEPEALAGSDFLDLVADEDRARLLGTLDEATQRRRSFRATLHLCCAGGLRPVQLQGIFLSALWEDTYPVALVAIIAKE